MNEKNTKYYSFKKIKFGDKNIYIHHKKLENFSHLLEAKVPLAGLPLSP